MARHSSASCVLSVVALCAAPAPSHALEHASPFKPGDGFQLELSLRATRQAKPSATIVCSHVATATLRAAKHGSGVAITVQPVKWWEGPGIGDCEPAQLLHAVAAAWRVDDTGDVSHVSVGPVPRHARAALADWSRDEQREHVENFWGGTFGMLHAAAITPIRRDGEEVAPELGLGGLVELKLSHDHHPCEGGVGRCPRAVVRGNIDGELEGQPVRVSTTEELLLDPQGRPARFRRQKVEPLTGVTTTFELRFRPLPAAARKK